MNNRRDWKKDLCNGAIGKMFLDSGAFGFHYKYCYDPKTGNRDFSVYETDAFWDYVDEYCNFILSNFSAFDFYANMDAIRNPELSWKVLKYMEAKGLHPIPVIHKGASIAILERHLEAGYDYIGLGGVGKYSFDNLKGYIEWADKLWNVLAPKSNDRHPIVRVHGFAMTAYRLLMRYPWYSTDSASWLKAAAYGNLYVPIYKDGEFRFFSEDSKGNRYYNLRPKFIKVSGLKDKKERRTKKVQLYESDNLVRNLEMQPRNIQHLVLRWLDHINVPIGSVDAEGNLLEEGVVSSLPCRAMANLIFYQRMGESKGPYKEQIFNPAKTKRRFLV
jgi:hypothetical protein